MGKVSSKPGEVKEGRGKKGDEHPSGSDTERRKSQKKATKSSDRSRRKGTPQQSGTSQPGPGPNFPLRRRETPLPSSAGQIIAKDLANVPAASTRKKEINAIEALSRSEYGIDWMAMINRFQRDDLFRNLVKGARKGESVVWIEADYGLAYTVKPEVKNDIWDDLLSRIPNPTDRHNLRRRQKQYYQQWALLEVLGGLIEASRKHYSAQNRLFKACHEDTEYSDQLNQRQGESESAFRTRMDEMIRAFGGGLNDRPPRLISTKELMKELDKPYNDEFDSED